MREHFDRLIDRINAHEVTALAQGDGFSEKKYEPASIDELLKIATFPKPPADAETTAAVKDDLRARCTTSTSPRTSRVLSAVELLQGRLHDYVQESLVRGAEVPADDPERVPRRGAAPRPRLHPDHRERLQDQRAVARPAPRDRGSS